MLCHPEKMLPLNREIDSGRTPHADLLFSWMYGMAPGIRTIPKW